METVKFMPDERRDPRYVECILARDAGIAQLLGKAKTLEQLHAARVGQIHLGMAGSGRVALHQQRADTIARQIERERSEEHTSELQSLMRISYAVFCLKKKTHNIINNQ